jgi:replicative DNA helicase
MTAAELPCDLSAERATLGAILLNRDAIIPIAPWLAPEDFYLAKHGDIYRAALACYRERIPPDTRTVAARLKAAGQLDSVGGLLYLTDLASDVPTSYHVEHYARPVQNAAALRRLVAIGGRIVALGYRADLAATDAQAEAQALLTTATTQQAAGGFKSVGDALAELHDAGAREPGLLTGNYELDKLTGGLGRGNLTLIAGVPGSGKTSLGMQVAWEYAKLHGPAAIFSFEMTRTELTERLIAYETGISASRQRADDLSVEEGDLVGRATVRMADHPLFIEDKRGLTTADIRLRSLRLMHEVGRLGVLVIDYLSLVNLEVGRNQTSAAAMNAAAQAFKNLAGDLECPVLLCAQLNREIFHRPDKRPMLSDIREAGEAPSDQVIVPMRPEVFDPSDRPGEATLYLVKNRHGPTGQAPAVYDGPRFRFRPAMLYRGVNGYGA